MQQLATLPTSQNNKKLDSEQLFSLFFTASSSFPSNDAEQHEESQQQQQDVAIATNSSNKDDISNKKEDENENEEEGLGFAKLFSEPDEQSKSSVKIETIRITSSAKCLEYILQTSIKQCNLQRKSAPYEMQCFARLLIHAASAGQLQHFVSNAEQFEHLLQIAHVAAQYVQAIFASLCKSCHATALPFHLFNTSYLPSCAFTLSS